jgi:lipoate-protein ligase B
VAGWRWLGRVPFAATAREQERLREALLAGTGAETLLLCEHEPVITLGRSARRDHVLALPRVLAGRDVAVEPASRGGAATFHGPGQLVGYPIVNLRHGVVAHVTAMSRALIDVLAQLGIDAVFRREAPGLWVDGAKICSFGIHVRRRVAIHGFALNVAGNLDGFDLIVPCGMPGGRVTSIARVLGGAAQIPPLHLLASRTARALGLELGVSFLPDIRPPCAAFGTFEGSRAARDELRGEASLRFTRPA